MQIVDDRLGERGRQPEQEARAEAEDGRAQRREDFLRSQSRSTTTTAVITTAAITRPRVDASSTPASGSPTSTNIASPTTTTPAPSTCRRTTCWLVSQYPSGSAHTMVVTISGWTTTSLPRSSAAPCVA